MDDLSTHLPPERVPDSQRIGRIVGVVLAAIIVAGLMAIAVRGLVADSPQVREATCPEVARAAAAKRDYPGPDFVRVDCSTAKVAVYDAAQIAPGYWGVLFEHANTPVGYRDFIVDSGKVHPGSDYEVDTTWRVAVFKTATEEAVMPQTAPKPARAHMVGDETRQLTLVGNQDDPDLKVSPDFMAFDGMVPESRMGGAVVGDDGKLIGIAYKRLEDQHVVLVVPADRLWLLAESLNR